MTSQQTGTTMTTVAPGRSRGLFSLATDSWASNVALVSKQFGAPALFAGATTAVDQWATAMGLLLRAQRQYLSTVSATVGAVSGLAARAVRPLDARNGAATDGMIQRPVVDSPPAEIESAQRVQLRRAEETQRAEVDAAQEALVEAARDQAAAVKAAEAAEALAELKRADDERAELEAAARAAELERERVRVARNLARQQARRAAKAKADREAKAAAAEAAARAAAEETAREEAAAKRAAHAELAAKQGQARQDARAAHVGRRKAELVEELAKRGLPKSGNVADLIERLVDADLA